MIRPNVKAYEWLVEWLSRSPRRTAVLEGDGRVVLYDPTKQMADDFGSLDIAWADGERFYTGFSKQYEVELKFYKNKTALERDKYQRANIKSLSRLMIVQAKTPGAAIDIAITLARSELSEKDWDVTVASVATPV